MAIHSLLHKTIHEVGILSLHRSSLDAKLLCLQRFVRLFAYGGAALILILYLSALGVSDSKVGLFMTLTLIGDVFISFFLTFFADGLGRKNVLCLGALLVSASGVVFALSGNYWVLLAAAVLGVISPAGNEIGPFKAIEESTLAHITAEEHRSDIYAWYNLVGQAGSALGMMSCGWAVERLKNLDGWDLLSAYRAIFFAYAGLGFVKFALTLSLSRMIEVEFDATENGNGSQGSEQAPLLADNHVQHVQKAKNRRIAFAFPHISRQSIAIFINLCFLFGLDSLGSGMMSLSWFTYYFKLKFSLEEGYLGTFFFITSMIQAMSTIFASSIARRIGNVQTMVVTHLPASIFLALIPLPKTLAPSFTLVVLRSCISQMDVGPRSAFVAAIVLPGERTAIMGVVNVVKTFSQSIGPGITGLLAENNLFWVAFVLAGGFKIVYDLGLLGTFIGFERRDEVQERVGDDEESVN